MSSDPHAEYPNCMDNAEPLCGDGDPSNTHGLPFFVAGNYVYNTDAHCRQCYRGVAVTEMRAGVVTSANYGWSSNGDNQTGEERAKVLHQKGGIARKPSKVVVLLETGRIHEKTKEELELGKRSEVARVRQYRNNREEVGWFVDQGVEI